MQNFLNTYCIWTSRENPFPSLPTLMIMIWFNKFTIVFIFTLLTTNVAALGRPYKDNSYMSYYYGCQAQMNAEVSFCDMRDRRCSVCGDKNAVATIAGCMQALGKTSPKYTSAMIQGCRRSRVKIRRDWFDEAIEHYNKNAKSVSEIPGFNKHMVPQVPIKLNPNNSELYQESYKRFYDNYGHSLYYGAGILGYWALVLLLGAVFNWSKVLFPNASKKMTHPLLNYWRKHVTMPAAFGTKRTQEQNFLKFFGFLIPSRFESLVIALFYGVVLLCNALNIEALDNDPRFNGSRYKAEIRYVADRTGITATMFMPLIFLFAGRNNFLQWVTRWNFGTFITYHRHTSRVMFMLVVIHAVCFTIAEGDRYSRAVTRNYFIWGIVATVAGGILLGSLMLYLRRRWYEWFLLAHIAFAVIWVVGTWYHVVDLGYIQMVYPTVAIFAFDRLVRIVRLIWFGFPKADVYLLADETLKVVVPKPKSWRLIPGGHAFIHFLKPSYFWQSHPFTFTDSVEKECSIVLFCKVKGGITHSLYKTLVASPDKRCKIRVGIEGPYGEDTPAKYADTAVFIAGGNGIPGIYSEVYDIARRGKNQSSRISLKLMWVVREWKSLHWFYEELQSLKNTNIETTIYVTQPSRFSCIEEFARNSNSDDSIDEEKNDAKEQVNISSEVKEIHLSENSSSCDEIGGAGTGAGVGVDVDDYDEKSNSLEIISLIKNDLSHIQFKEGRPNIEEIVATEIHESMGSTAFVTCGHSVMVDQLRYYCAENVDNKEKKRVDFYEQVQVWS